MVTRNGTSRAAVGEVDVDVAEVGFEALAREVSQRDEGLLMSRPVLAQVALDLGVAAGVAVLVAEAAEDLGGGVPLLGRGGLVVDQDLVDDRLERPEDRGGSVPGRGLGTGLGMVEDLPDGLPRVCRIARAICRMDMPSRRARRIAP